MIRKALKRLQHEHQAHGVAQFHEFGSRHIVGSAHGISAHILEHAELAGYGLPVDCRSEGAEVMVEAHALELAFLPVEIEAVPFTQFYGAYAEGSGVGIESASVALHACHGLIHVGTLGTPQARSRHTQILCHAEAGKRNNLNSPNNNSNPNVNPSRSSNIITNRIWTIK